MEAKTFQVQRYKNIHDSGPVDLDDLTAIVGKNEAGKTALLKALHKFNPFTPEPYNIEREWPRGHRRTRDSKQIVVTVTFKLSTREIEELNQLTDQTYSDDLIQVTKNYDGEFEVLFPDGLFPDRIHPNDIDAICDHLPDVPKPAGDDFTKTANACCEETKRTAKEGRYSEFGDLTDNHLQKLAQFASQNDSQPHKRNENQFIQQYKAALQKISDRLARESSMQEKAHEHVIDLLPTFIYMSDLRSFSGSALLDQVQQRKNNQKLTYEDETLLMIMELAGLDLDTEAEKGKANDREQRQYDLDDASESLTRDIEGRWKQRRYEIQFRADGSHFFTMVKDEHSGLIPLEERSRGFQWFFSFDLMFMHESQGNFEGCVILLDEPGLHLHPEAQGDLLERMEEYAKGNRLIYTTHLPFMLDLRSPSRIRVLTEADNRTAYVTEDITLSKPDEKLTLQAALGMSGRQSYLLALRNLVVEGADDFMIITELSNLLIRSGDEGLPEDVYVTAGGGASEAVYIATFMIGQELEVVALFDSDQAGRDAEEKLRKKWLTHYKDARAASLLLGSAVGRDNTMSFAIEDIFPDEYYLKKVYEVYGDRLAAAGINNLVLEGSDLICNRMERAFEQHSVGKFNKGSVAKRIKSDLIAMKTADELPAGAKENAAALIKYVRESFSEQ